MKPLRQAFHSLRRSPASSLPAVVMLAGGIAASACCYAVLDAAVYRAIPYALPDQLFQVTIEGRSMRHSKPSLADFESIARVAHSFDSLWYEEDSPAVLSPQTGQSYTVTAARISRDYFKTLGLRATLGRLPGPGDFELNRPTSVVLSHALWVAKFSSKKDVPGDHIRVDDEDMAIVGVLPEKVRRPVSIADLWIVDTGSTRDRGGRDKYVIGRLRRSISVERAARELAVLTPLATPGFSVEELGTERYGLLSVVDQLVGPSSRILQLLLLACLILQLLACLSVGQLLVARRIGKMREMGIRLALGASTRRLWVDVLLETAVLALLAFAGASAAVFLFLPVASAAASIALGSPIDARFTEQVAGFSVLLALASTLLCSLFPILLLSRLEALTLIRARWEGRGWNVTASRLQEVLMIAQLAATIVLAISFGLLVKSMYRLTAVSIGFDSRELSLFVFSGSRHPFPASAFKARDAVLELSRAQGVKSVAVGSVPLLIGTAMKLDGVGVRMNDGAWAPLAPVLLNAVSTGYFETLGAPLIEGRSFTGEDRQGAPCVVIVNQALARGAWPGQRPTGQRITLDVNSQPRSTCEVIGVVGDLRDIALARPAEPELFTSMLQTEAARNAVVLVRMKAGLSIAPQLVTKAMAGADSSRELMFTSDIGNLVDTAVAPAATRLRLFGALACTALLLASAGAFAAARFGLSLRMRELGVRLALGGPPAQIVALICGRYLKLSVYGVLLGIAASAPFLRLFATSAALFDMTVAATVSGACLVPMMVSMIVPTMIAVQAAPSRLLLTDTDGM